MSVCLSVVCFIMYALQGRNLVERVQVASGSSGDRFGETLDERLGVRRVG